MPSEFEDFVNSPLPLRRDWLGWVAFRLTAKLLLSVMKPNCWCSLRIWFCFFWKKKSFLFWVWPMGTFLHKLGRKIVIFRKRFFRTTGFQLKFLIFIEFPNILHWKSAKKSNQVWSWGKTWAKLCPMLWKE